MESLVAASGDSGKIGSSRGDGLHITSSAHLRRPPLFEVIHWSHVIPYSSISS